LYRSSQQTSDPAFPDRNSRTFDRRNHFTQPGNVARRSNGFPAQSSRDLRRQSISRTFANGPRDIAFARTVNQ
jgi:hypothetical protein